MELLPPSAADSLFESELLETHDKQPDKKKTQHFYSDMINRSRVKYMKDLIQDKAGDRAKVAFLSNDGSFAGASLLFTIPKDNYNTSYVNVGIQNCH